MEALEKATYRLLKFMYKKNRCLDIDLEKALKISPDALYRKCINLVQLGFLYSGSTSCDKDGFPSGNAIYTITDMGKAYIEATSSEDRKNRRAILWDIINSIIALGGLIAGIVSLILQYRPEK